MKSADYVIVGAGIVGATIGLELLKRGLGHVKIIEKEGQLGAHGSGRNSGVLHAGIYYPPKSLKATLCVEGARRLRQYLEEKKLRHSKCGKLIVPQREELEPQIDVLLERSRLNGVDVREVTSQEIREIEPLSRPFRRALFSPNTWTFDPKEVLGQVLKDFSTLGGELALDEEYQEYDSRQRVVRTQKSSAPCGYLVNAAGLWADRVAHSQGVGLDYRILPFRGSYLKMSERLSSQVRGLIYPVPDMNLPFLGVHVTKGVYGQVTLGPTATPALGRENYSGVKGTRGSDLWNISKLMAALVTSNQSNMRNHMKEEIQMHFRPHFIKRLKELVPDVTSADLKSSNKVGLRAQVVRQSDLSMCMDFIVEKGEHSLHVINAVSPAFSASMAFAEYVVDQIQ